ncbi:hypothetical protein V6N13_089890 [Hibiscus sabdariffa]
MFQGFKLHLLLIRRKSIRMVLDTRRRAMFQVYWILFGFEGRIMVPTTHIGSKTCSIDLELELGRFQHVPRTKNKMVDGMIKMAPMDVLECAKFIAPPEGIFDVLHEDTVSW